MAKMSRPGCHAALMVECNVTIQNGDGLHTRPASVFVRAAGKFKSAVQLDHEGTTVNGKSIMGILMLALAPGSSVQLRVEGPDEGEAAAHLAELLSGNFE